MSKEAKTTKKKKHKWVFYFKTTLLVGLLLLIATTYLFIQWRNDTFNVYFYLDEQTLVATYENIPMKNIEPPILDEQEGYTFYGWRDKESQRIFDFNNLIRKEMTFNAVFVDDTYFENHLDLSESRLYKDAQTLNGEDLKTFLKSTYTLQTNRESDIYYIHQYNTYENQIYLLFQDDFLIDDQTSDDLLVSVPMFQDHHLKGFTQAEKQNIQHDRYQRFIDLNIENNHLQLPFGKGEGFFEPDDTFKGMVARIVLYMWLFYDAIDLNETIMNFNNEKHLIALETVLDWHFSYPPNDFEIERNKHTLIALERDNPFVSHPDFVKFIFKDAMIYLGIEGL